VSLGADHRGILAGTRECLATLAGVRLRLPALALTLLLAGCGGEEPTAAERRAEVVAQLAQDLRVETDGALDEEMATCVATELVDAVGEDRFDEVVAAVDDHASPLRDQVIDVFASCDALDPLLEGAD
jgi:hypothetical protein